MIQTRRQSLMGELEALRPQRGSLDRVAALTGVSRERERALRVGLRRVR